MVFTRNNHENVQQHAMLGDDMRCLFSVPLAIIWQLSGLWTCFCNIVGTLHVKMDTWCLMILLVPSPTLHPYESQLGMVKWPKLTQWLTNYMQKLHCYQGTMCQVPGVISNDLGLEDKHQEGQCQVPGGRKCVGKKHWKNAFGLWEAKLRESAHSK